jgi:hypothetical protein
VHRISKFYFIDCWLYMLWLRDLCTCILCICASVLILSIVFLCDLYTSQSCANFGSNWKYSLVLILFSKMFILNHLCYKIFCFKLRINTYWTYIFELTVYDQKPFFFLWKIANYTYKLWLHYRLRLINFFLNSNIRHFRYIFWDQLIETLCCQSNLFCGN